MMGCMIVVNEQTWKTCEKPTVELMWLPLDLRDDNETGRESRLAIIGFSKGHWEQRREFASSGRVQWSRAGGRELKWLMA